jgi:hypothetical protein
MILQQVKLAPLFMKKDWLLIISLALVVTGSFAQANVAKYYCQGCCGGVGEHYLKLDSVNKFELYYLVENTLHGNSAFGIGTYIIKGEVLILTFEDIPPAVVESKKIHERDSLLIRFYSMDNVRGDSVMLMNAKLKNGRSFFYTYASGKIRSRFVNNEIVNFSSIGFSSISYSLTEPGEYRLIVRLNPEGIPLTRGNVMKLKIIKRDKVERLEGIDDKNLVFTTKSCNR